MKKLLLHLVLLLSFSIFCKKAQAQLPGPGNILYVNASGSAGSYGLGMSWSSPIKELADALLWARLQNNFTAANPLKIFVAQGTYRPLYNAADGSFTTNGYRSNAFVMVKNVQIYGGFSPVIGIDDLTDTRSPSNTILSGDIGTVGITMDNAYHVVISSGDVGNALLDGFTVTNAFSTTLDNAFIYVNNLSVGYQYTGGGFQIEQSSPTIKDCIIMNNTARYGSGMSINNHSSPTITQCRFINNTASEDAAGIGIWSSSSPTIIGCSFTNNIANENGGAMYNTTASSVTITNCNFTKNQAVSGGGMYNSSSSTVKITNSVFSENTATDGGGFYTYASPSITNCLFTENTASANGGAIYNISLPSNPSSVIITNTTIANNGNKGLYISGSTANPVFQNTIAWENITKVASGNYTANYSLLKGLNPLGTSNINATSLAATAIFNDYDNGDYSLKSSSVALNKGNNAFNATSTDLAGNGRIFNNGIIDLGAYEYQGNPTTLPVTFGKFSAIPQSNRVKLDWNTFSETNNAGFIIYRSADGVNYTEIAQQVSKGSSANSYTTFDYSPANGVNYYRLSQKDNDGTITNLADAVVNFSLVNAEVKAWPNPVAKTLHVSFSAGKYQSFRLVDVTGKTLLERNIASAQSETEIEMSTYPKGIYVVALKGNNGSHLVKVIK